MLKKEKKLKCVLNFSIFAGIMPLSLSGIVALNAKNFVNKKTEISNDNQFVDTGALRFNNGKNDIYVSLRSNPMNNFVCLTSDKTKTKENTNEQFTYALCDTSTSQEGIKYGKNSGIAKLNSYGRVISLWILPNTDKNEENEYIYTTNIVFGNTEETLYVLCGINNPAAALNRVYGDADVPSKINYGEDAAITESESEVAYFYRNKLKTDGIFARDEKSIYKVDIKNFSFKNYPKIKIYKLDAINLLQLAKYDFEFPPAATGKLNDPLTAFNEYDKTIIAGFGGGQHLNYWSTNSTWITNYQTKNNQSISLMNSSFFHYLQFGQTFDYVGNEQFVMVPTYIGIDLNLGGLYSLISEKLTGSIASLSSYPSLYNVLYKYKGKPEVDKDSKVIDFNKPNSNESVSNYQYQYLDALGKKVDVVKDSEFALKDNVVNLILLSIGYFYPDHTWSSNYGIDMEKAINSVPGWLLSTYGVICFSPREEKVVNKYKLYVFNKNPDFGLPTSQFVIFNMFINKDPYGKKVYRFFSKTTFGAFTSSYDDHFNSDGRNVILYGTRNLNGDQIPLGFTWDQFKNKYDTIQNSQFNATKKTIELTGVNNNSKKWTDHNGDNEEYYNNLNSILTVKDYYNSSEYPLGWHTDLEFSDLPVTEFKNAFSFSDIDFSSSYSGFPSSSGSKYINYGDKIIISDPVWLSKLVVVGNIDFVTSLKLIYDKSYEYSSYPSSLMLFDRIAVLFAFPNNEGFGYLTYKNKLKICYEKAMNLSNQLTSENFNALVYDQDDSSVFQSVVPVGNILFTSLLKNDKTVTNGHFHLQDIEDNDLTMWIIIGVCSAAAMFIALGLGIGIPMRKNAKLQLATTKLANKKIDMLSTTVAKSFKKLAENTNTLLKNQPKVLATKTTGQAKQSERLVKQTVSVIKPIKPVRLIKPGLSKPSTRFVKPTVETPNSKSSFSVPIKKISSTDEAK